MTTYEYMLLEDSDVYRYNLSDINRYGKLGWRVVWTKITDDGYEKTLLERYDVQQNDSNQENSGSN